MEKVRLWPGPPEEVTLGLVAPKRPQAIGLRLRLHALGDDHDPKCPPEGDHRLHDCGVPLAKTQPLREQGKNLATEARLQRLRDARPVTPNALSDRAADVWEPLIAIADDAGGDWPSPAAAASTRFPVASVGG